MPKLNVEIILRDELNEEYSNWFEGLNIEKIEYHRTRLSGEIADQPALHGFLERIRDLNLHLASVQVTPIYQKDINTEVNL